MLFTRSLSRQFECLCQFYFWRCKILKMLALTLWRIKNTYFYSTTLSHPCQQSIFLVICKNFPPFFFSQKKYSFHNKKNTVRFRVFLQNAVFVMILFLLQKPHKNQKIYFSDLFYGLIMTKPFVIPICPFLPFF